MDCFGNLFAAPVTGSHCAWDCGGLWRETSAKQAMSVGTPHLTRTPKGCAKSTPFGLYPSPMKLAICDLAVECRVAEIPLLASIVPKLVPSSSSSKTLTSPARGQG